MTSKSKLEKLERILKPKTIEKKDLRKLAIPFSSINGQNPSTDPIVEMSQEELDNFERLLVFLYGDKDKTKTSVDEI